MIIKIYFIFLFCLMYYLIINGLNFYFCLIIFLFIINFEYLNYSKIHIFLKFMCDKYNNLIKTYQRCSCSYDDYLDSKKLEIEERECQLLNEITLNNNKFYDELQ